MSRRPTHALDRHVALIGFMGAGKTTLGQSLARALARPFVDLDAEIVREAGMSIEDIFAERGEPAFRSLEERLALELLGRSGATIVALGGGAVGSQAIRATLAARALTVLLEVELEEAWERAQGAGRPLAQDFERFRALYAERRSLYVQTADARAHDLAGAVLAAAGIHAEPGSLGRLGELVPGGARVALVADRRVLELHGQAAIAALGERLVSTQGLPSGEAAKSFDCYRRLLEELRLERGDVLVGLGGGTTTDLAGFAAATYMRGIDWIAVPTTLVGQVDAAIGGKTAIDLGSGKNLVGAFHWPARVVIDAELLATLPPEQRREGMAEAVKTGLLAGSEVWELPDAGLVRACAAFKAKVCLRDPRERDERAQLNLGHTFAHALETAGDFGRPTHGEAVALGLMAALRLSLERGLDPGTLRVVEEALEPTPVAVDRERAWTALFRDKKVAGGSPRMVLLERPGRPIWNVTVPEPELRSALDALIVS
ncbi:MAG: bifunctional shikimate kinase/3-dehydroquinate synthase [Gaiellaceae bacterium]